MKLINHVMKSQTATTL